MASMYICIVCNVELAERAENSSNMISYSRLAHQHDPYGTDIMVILAILLSSEIDLGLF